MISSPCIVRDVPFRMWGALWRVLCALDAVLSVVIGVHGCGACDTRTNCPSCPRRHTKGLDLMGL